MNDPLEMALEWQRQGNAIALATVVETWGSAPRRAGSVMACNDRGEFAGSVSGGCVEVAVVEAAREICTGAPPRVLEFGVSDEQAWSVGLACGGRIRVFVAVPATGVLEALVAARVQQRAIARAQALDGSQDEPLEAATESALREPVALALRSDQAIVAAHDGRDWLVSPYNPPLRLVIIGAVHTAESLCAIARIAGHAVTLVDPRSAFLRPALFPGVTLSDEWPQRLLPKLGVDARCAAVLLTHDPKIDDPALEVLLQTPAYYIGALGSRRTHARRLERLLSAGHSPASLARIRGPAGLDIGARSPAEIAVSILAELTAALRKPVGAG